MDTPRRAIHRKPLPKHGYDAPASSLAAEQPPEYSERPPPMPAMPTRHPDKASAEPSFDRRLRELHLDHETPSFDYPSPRRQATSSTAVSSSSANSTLFDVHSRASTFRTDVTTPSSPSLSPSLSLSPSGISTPVSEKPTTIPSDAMGQHGPGAAMTDKKEPSFWKTAFDETRFFAGGLLHKPYESTKHYTLVRHSPGLIMYRGPSTCVVVTVFSSPDHPVPPDRTVWMQRRGYSGDTGLRLKTLVGASGSWLDVTPERKASASSLPVADERGYQRDIAKILKRGKKGGDKQLAKRVPRETLVIRIPAAAEDGYFRVVLCAGGVTVTGSNGESTRTKRKVLCGSPVFRVASTSTDSSIFRGASLRTLPLEAGVYVASMIGTNTVSTVAEPVVGAVQTQVQRFQPGTMATMAATTAYDASGAGDRLANMGEAYDERRETAYSRIGGGAEEDVPPEVIGPDAGPLPPFPLSFSGRVVSGSGQSAARFGVPTANLNSVPDDIRMRLRGTYFGWASVTPPRDSKNPQHARLPQDWIEAVVTVGPSPWLHPTSVAPRNEVAVHLLYDFGSVSLCDTKLNVLLMGFLRSNPAQSKSQPQPAVASNSDVAVVVASLSRPRWGPQATMARMQTAKSERSLSDKMVDARGRVQNKVDRLPAHWVGVRTAGAEMRDQVYGNGGVAIPR